MSASVTLRRMVPDDLATVEEWFRSPHIARWFLPESSAAVELEKYRLRVDDPFSPTTMCTVELEGRSIGWCQWYRWRDYPEDAACIGAAPAEVGADYAIGDPEMTGSGIGTMIMATIVGGLQRRYPHAGVLVAPEAANVASRRILEKNNFQLVDVRPVATEPHGRPMAIYRRHPA